MTMQKWMGFILSAVVSAAGTMSGIAGEAAVIGPQLPAAEITAVQELRHYLAQAAPEGFAMADGSEEVVFHVGRSDWAMAQGIDFGALAEDEYIIRSFGNRIVIAGGGSRGTLYGVYAFLEKYLQIHWLSPSVEVVPVHAGKVKLGTLDERVRPRFLFRAIFPDTTSHNDGGAFAVRNRLNGYGTLGIAPEYGGAMRFGSPDHCHTFDPYFPESEYRDTHPEYFSLVGGHRVGGQFTGQICLTNPEVLRLTIDKLKAYIVADEAEALRFGVPAPTIYEISQNDNSTYCQCGDCAAITARENYSGLILHFVNAVAAELSTFRPGYRISTLAYQNSENPPASGIRPADNVLIKLCNTSNNKAGSILAVAMAPFRDKVRQWEKLSNTLFAWEYGTTYRPEYLPHPSEYVLGDLYRFYADNDVKMVFIEHQSPEKGDMHALKTWLETQFLQQPEAQLDALLDVFYPAYYGGAAPDIRRYRELLRDEALRRNSYIFIHADSYNFLTLEVMLEAFACFERAETAVRHDPVLRGRVEREKFNLEQAALVFFRRLNQEWVESGRDPASFPWHQQQLLATIERKWLEYIDTQIQESYREEKRAAIETFKAMFAGLPDTVKAPSDLPGAPERVIDLTADFALIHRNQLVVDPESEAGFAVFADWRSFGFSDTAAPLAAGVWSESRGVRLAELAAADPDTAAGPGYRYFHLGTVTPEATAYMYLLTDWGIQFPLDRAFAEYPGMAFDVYVSAKFSGAPYRFSTAEAPYGVFIDRCILVPHL